jgi:hypothetical protein
MAVNGKVIRMADALSGARPTSKRRHKTPQGGHRVSPDDRPAACRNVRLDQKSFRSVTKN